MISNSFHKLKLYELYSPYRLLKAANLRLFRNVSVDLADVVGLLEEPISAQGSYIFTHERDRIPGSIPKPENRVVEEDKLRFEVRCLKHKLRTPKIICIISTSDESDTGWDEAIISTEEEFYQLLQTIGDTHGVCKPIEGGRGFHVFPVEIRDHSIVDPVAVETATAFFRYLKNLGRSEFRWILQERIQVHESLTELMPGPGLGTIRIYSALKKDNTVEIFWPILKIPGSGLFVDNWRMGMGGGLLAYVDPVTGVLGKGIGRRSSNSRCERYTTSPVSGAQIEGVKLPFWNELLELTTNAAKAFPEIPALSWDIAVSQSGPVLIEGNWMFSFEFTQAVYRRGMRNDFIKYYKIAQNEN